MATQGSVKLSGRFPPGTQVRLVRVRDERVLRAEGGEEVGTATVDEDGVVEFSKGVCAGNRYFICGYADTYREVRVRGRAKDDVAEVLEQPPIGFDRVKLSDGTFVDEPPEQHQSEHVAPVATGQHQVSKGTVQRSDTPRGTAQPVPDGEAAPYARQEDVKEGTVQMSSTETGRAVPVLPHHEFPVVTEAAPAVPGAPNKRDVVTGHDAQGQPLYADAAAAVGVEPASEPVESGSKKPAKKSTRRKPASKSATTQSRGAGGSRTQSTKAKEK